MRVKTGAVRRKRHKKILKRAKGFYSANSRCYKVSAEKSDRALAYQYRDRRRLKREKRSLWIQKINAAVRLHQLNYSTFIQLLKKNHIDMNRKMLAEMATQDRAGFSHLVKQIMPSQPTKNL